MNQPLNKNVNYLESDNLEKLLKLRFKICTLHPGKKYPKGISDWCNCEQSVDVLRRVGAENGHTEDRQLLTGSQCLNCAIAGETTE